MKTGQQKRLDTHAALMETTQNDTLRKAENKIIKNVLMP